MANNDIQGQVTDGGSGVSGAVVEVSRARSDGSPQTETVKRVTTDSNGNYTIQKHPDWKESNDEWHVSTYYYDSGTGEWKNDESKPAVTANLSPNEYPLITEAAAWYDFQEEDGSFPIEDKTNYGNDLTSGNFDGVGKSINGVQAGDFTGSGKYASGDPFTQGAISSPWEIHMVFREPSNGYDPLMAAGDGDMVVYSDVNFNNNYGFNQTAAIRGGTPDTNPHQISATADATDVLRLDGSTLASGDAGTADINAPVIGASDSGGQGSSGDVVIGEAIFFDRALTSSERDQIENYFTNKWSV
jgi:hypothetical protein